MLTYSSVEIIFFYFTMIFLKFTGTRCIKLINMDFTELWQLSFVFKKNGPFILFGYFQIFISFIVIFIWDT